MTLTKVLNMTGDHWNLTKENDHNKDSIHLYFDISKSKPSSNVNFNVSSAVLKIYKKAFKVRMKLSFVMGFYLIQRQRFKLQIQVERENSRIRLP